MKRNLLRIAAVVIIAAISVNFANAQEPKKNVSYNFINEYGFFIGKNVGFTGVFVNGVKFKNEAFGIGVGYGANTSASQEVPIFFNYRHHFDKGKKLVPHINIAAGTSLQFWTDELRVPIIVNGDIDHYEWQEVNSHGFGFYSTIAGGFTVKALSFSAGFFFRTFPRYNQFNGGIEAKIGYTF